MKDKLIYYLTGCIFLLVALGVGINIKQQFEVDYSKIPNKVEENSGFQRWITNLKNKDIEIEADEFRLIEENEIYNTKWMQVFSIDQDGKKEEFENNLLKHRDIKKVIFSPSDREYIDYRYEYRDGYAPNEVHFYGLKEDKIIDARILDCSTRANCYFDRAYFLDNNVFVISEISRNIHKHDETSPFCSQSETCTYTFKIHVIDLINNSRYVYESKPLELIMEEVRPEL
ncbi:hypothetical protein JXA34_02690 [Patescibacteria group bacterium]|nr:hypothetical protein [Patescibacteria group bacterium]